jgi:RNA polymerase sigma-70 factor (ECF subfamily)
MDKAEEKAFVRRLARMDGETWEMFCKEYSILLLEFVKHSLGCNTEETEEVVHRTFVRCVQSIHTFKPSRGRLFGWLKAISRNEAHTLMHQGCRTTRMIPLSTLEAYATGEILHKIDSGPIPDELLAVKDLQLLVQETLLELNSRHRDALTRKYVDNLTVSEIAHKTRASEKAIESVLARARAAFRKALLEKLQSKEAKVGSYFRERA